MITQERLRALFQYDVNGDLVRRVSVKGRNAGDVLGTEKPKGYLVGIVDGEMYRVHHLVWFYHHGYFEVELDHINRVRNDNRIENLRPCTHSQNLGNQRPRVHKYKGVTFCKQTQKWMSQIAGKKIGRFLTIEEAALAYNKKAVEHFGEFAYLNEIT
jgi:hypothetical protein